jgi:hypothetical protein
MDPQHCWLVIIQTNLFGADDLFPPSQACFYIIHIEDVHSRSLVRTKPRANLGNMEGHGNTKTQVTNSETNAHCFVVRSNDNSKQRFQYIPTYWSKSFLRSGPFRDDERRNIAKADPTN